MKENFKFESRVKKNVKFSCGESRKQVIPAVNILVALGRGEVLILRPSRRQPHYRVLPNAHEFFRLRFLENLVFDHVLIDHSYTGSGMTLYQTLMTAIEFNNVLEKRNRMNYFTTAIKLICFAKELFFNSQLLPLN